MGRLSNKRALITGGTTGIGLEVARLFLAEGARIAITGSRAETVATAQAELGPRVTSIVSDASNVADQKTLAERIEAEFGGVDIVLINAGIAELRPVEQWDEQAFDRSLAVNFKGPFFLLQALLPILANPASIVLNTSINAHIGMPNSSVYAASKAALLSLARTLSGELVERGIRVNAVSPGPIATPLFGKLGMSDSDVAELVKQVPAGRQGKPSEVAQAMLFFASDDSAFNLGSELIIDGGMGTL